jgi:glutamate dehydrogenase
MTHIKEMEQNGFFDRTVENFPDDKKLLERKSAVEGLTRPEIAVLLEYTKIYLKHSILQTSIPEDAHISSVVENAFPPSIRTNYKAAMRDHRLYRDIVATQLTNIIINTMGITFVHRAQTETGASIEDVVRAFTVASQIFNASNLIKMVDDLGFRLPVNKQYEMLYNIRNLIHLATRWFLHSILLKGNLQDLIAHYTKKVRRLEEIIPELMAGYTRQYLQDLINEFLAEGLPRETAQRIATYRAIYTSLNIIDVSTREAFDLIKTAEVYFCSGERMNMLWFRDQINQDTRDGHWNVLARLTLRDELDLVQRALTVAIMKNHQDGATSLEMVNAWIDKNRPSMNRWDSMLTALHSSPSIDYSMFFIAVRELMAIILRSMGSPRY